MIVIVEDKRECVSFCDMEFKQFMRLNIIVSFARTHSCCKIRQAASELSLNCRWIIDLNEETISLLRIPWEQAFILRAVLFLYSERKIGDESRRSVNSLMTMIQTAIKSSLKMDCAAYDKRARDIYLR